MSAARALVVLDADLAPVEAWEAAVDLAFTGVAVVDVLAVLEGLSALGATPPPPSNRAAEMRPILVPDVELPAGARRLIVGPDDPTDPHVRSYECIVSPSTLHPGRFQYTSVVALDDQDRAAIAAGAHLVLILDGAVVPWDLATWPDPTIKYSDPEEP